MQPVGKKDSVQFLPHRGKKSAAARFNGRPAASLKGQTFSQATASTLDSKRQRERRLCHLLDRAVTVQEAIPLTNFSDKKSYPDSLARSNFQEFRSIHSKLDAIRRSPSFASFNPKLQNKVPSHQVRIENALAYNISNLSEFRRFELVVELSQLYLDEPVLKDTRKTQCMNCFGHALARLVSACQCSLDEDLLNSERLIKLEEWRGFVEKYELSLEPAEHFNLYHHLGLAYTRLHRNEEAAWCFQVAYGAPPDDSGTSHGGAPFDPHRALTILGVPDQQAGTACKTSGQSRRESQALPDDGELVNQRLARAYLACARENNQQIHDYLLATIRLITVSVLNDESIDSAIGLISEVCRMIKDLPFSAEKNRLRKEAATMLNRVALHIRRSYSDNEELGLLDKLLPDAPPESRQNMLNRKFQIHWHSKEADCAYEVLNQLKSQPSVNYYCNLSMLSTARRNYKDALEYLEKARGKIDHRNPKDIYTFHKRAAFLYKTVAESRYWHDLFPEESQKEVFDEALCHASIALYYAEKKENLSELEALMTKLKA